MKKNKRKKGFTLIELLAIIVILAIIAVITVPIILNIVDNAKKGAAVSSAYGYTDSITKFYLNKLSLHDDSRIGDSMFEVSDIEEMGILYNGNKPSDGWVYYSDNRISDSCLVFDGYKVVYENGKFKSTGKGTCSFVENFASNDSNPGVICGDGDTDDYNNSSSCYINSVEDMVTFSNMVNSGKSFQDKTVYLMSNLDFSNPESYSNSSLNQFGDFNGDGIVSDSLIDELTNQSGNGFKPIGNESNRFFGTFDAGSYKIKNLYINYSNTYGVGLFGYNSGTIKGLILDSSNIIGRKYVASIAGYNYGTVSGSMVINGGVSGNTCVGLSVGYNDEGYVESYVSGDVVSSANDDPYVAGIVGDSYRGTVNGVYSSGSIVVDEGRYNSRYAYLAIGHMWGASSSSVVSNSVLFNGSGVSSYDLTSTDGYVASENSLKSVGLLDSSIDTYIAGDNNHDGYYYGFDKKGNIKLYSLANAPLDITLDREGTDGPYLVKSYSDLKQVSYALNGNYKLDADLDLNDKLPIMIASQRNPFTGSFDGDGHVISNIDIIGSNQTGLFGNNFGIVKNISLENVDVSGYDQVGTISGNNSGTIKGVSIANANVVGNQYVGGIVGKNISTGILNTTMFSGNVTGSSRLALSCGDNDQGVIQSVVSGNFYLSDGASTSDIYAGGIVGNNYLGSIRGAFISGSISINSTSYVNRIAGYNYFNVMSTVALDSIQVNGNTVSSSSLDSRDGKSYSVNDLATSAPYQEVGLNFTESDSNISEYIWYFDNGNLKFRRN